jgi:hypothetical protein
MKPANHYPHYLQASNIEKSTVSMQKEICGTMATPPKQYIEAEQNASSSDAMLKCGTCEVCQ